MNVLDFPIRIFERDDDTVVLMVPHEPVTDWFDKATKKAKTDHTRSFVSWLRKQFPDVPTEFSYLNKRWGAPKSRAFYARRPRVNCDRHFMAYGITKQQMLLIKLSWQFKTETAHTDPYKGKFQLAKDPEPSTTLVQRMAKKAQNTELKTS